TPFFFSSRRRHTRSDRDWSSDVCSSDLACVPPRLLRGWPFHGTAPRSAPAADSRCSHSLSAAPEQPRRAKCRVAGAHLRLVPPRSEERRVGKEWRSRGGGCQQKKNRGVR